MRYRLGENQRESDQFMHYLHYVKPTIAAISLGCRECGDDWEPAASTRRRWLLHPDAALGVPRTPD